MRLSDYSFGEIKVDGQKKTSDFILHGDWLHDWWRESGHRVVPADLEKLLARDPDHIVFGQGASGRMSVTARTRKQLEEKGVKFQSLPTAEAVEKYNELENQGGDVAAALHLTC